VPNRIASPHHLSPRVSCVCRSKRPVGLQTGAFLAGLTLAFLAGLTLITGKRMRISPAIVLLSIPFCYAVLSSVSNFNMNRVSYMLYGDSSFTGRQIIWDFVNYEIARRPLW
jgi:exopolysaccharide production protein ExoQ